MGPKLPLPASGNKLVADARRKAKSRHYRGPPDQEVREGIPKAFKRKYGITVGVSRRPQLGTWPGRLRAERKRRHLYGRLAALFGHAHDGLDLLQREDARSRCGPALIDSERKTDGSKWKIGQALVHRPGR